MNEVEVKWNFISCLSDRLDLGWIVISHLEKGRGIWESSLGLLGSLVGELLRLLGIDDGFLSVGSFLVYVRSSSSSSSDKSWDWWNRWEWNSSSLPGDWIFELDKG